MTSAYSADPVFEANGKLISYLLQRIHDRELGLPDFQRDFVWDARATMELLRSIMSRFPAGTLLFWKQGTESAAFAAREVEGAPALNGKSPDELVLDGQQRLTALFRALNGTADERFYARLTHFCDSKGEPLPVHEVDFDKALACFDLTTKLQFDPEDRSYQFDNSLFPLRELSRFDEWLDDYARRSSDDILVESNLKRQMRAVRDSYFVPLRSYGFPVVTLPSTTPLEAVCNIFETLNRTGKPLGAFDLVTARLYPKEVHLRELWDDAREKYPLLEFFDIEPYSVLQAISLRARNSAQRSDVLSKLTADEVKNHWPLVISGMAALLDSLQNNYGVLSKKWLPYSMVLIPMAAAWPEIKSLRPLQQSSAFDRLSQFFWCTTFMTNYDQGANSQAGADYLKLKEWLADESKAAPEAVAEYNFSESTVYQANVRRKALHAGVMALTIMSGAKDFHSGQSITVNRVSERRIESHHIFPKAYLSNASRSELVLNRALIDSETKKIIGKQPPSQYVAKIMDVLDEDKVQDVLLSHGINTTPNSGLLTDEYEQFLLERLENLISLIEKATRKQSVRDITNPNLKDY